MATMEEIERMSGKAIFDADFRAFMFKDPAAAASSIGVTLTAAQINTITNIKPDEFEAWALQFPLSQGPKQGYLW